MSIRIVTDSTADLPTEVVEANRITVVPLTVLFGDEALRDGVDITSEQFFERLVRARELPTTSQPSAGAFREAYERLVADGATEILSIHVSGKLSGTLESARQGAEGIEDVRIVHVDSQVTTLALGMAVVAAAEAVEDGATLDEARARVEEQLRRTHTFFLVDTLEYLYRGGRIGRAAQIAGTMLQVKPLLALQDGEVKPVARVRTRPKAIEEMLRRVAALLPAELMMAAHATTTDDLELVAGRMRALAPHARLLTGRVGPVVGVHAGPGLLAVAVVSDPASDPVSDPVGDLVGDAEGDRGAAR